MIISDRLRRWFLRYNFRFGGSLSIAKIVSQGTGRDRMHGTPLGQQGPSCG